MALLPDIDEKGHIVEEVSDESWLMPVVDLLKEQFPSKYAEVQRLTRNEGKSVRRALEMVGVMVCDRSVKLKRRELVLR